MIFLSKNATKKLQFSIFELYLRIYENRNFDKRRSKKKKTNPRATGSKGWKKRSYISRIESDETNSINIKTLTEIVEKGLDGELKIKF